MSRSWKILEGHEPYESYRKHSKGKGDEYEEAFEEGFEEGYECGFGEAMEKISEERYSSSHHYGSRMGYRGDHDSEDMMMGERRGRRRRDSRGRYM